MPGPNAVKCLNTNIKESNNKCGCNICDTLPDHLHCRTTNVVYVYKCKICQQIYIGKTSRTISERVKEHSTSLNKSDKKSALSEHFINCHRDYYTHANINMFEFSILQHCQSPIFTAISEAQHIKKANPKMNRKHELSLL